MELTDNEEFIQLLQDKRHKEVIKILDKMLAQVSTDKEVKSPDVSVNVDMSPIEEIIKTINTSPADYDIPKSIQIMTDVIVKKLELLKTTPAPTEWYFDVERNVQGYIKGVKAKSNAL